MRVGGCFFIADNGGGGIPTDVQNVFKEKPFWTNIHETSSHVTHTLENYTVQKLSRFLLPGSKCARQTKVFCQVWIKTEPEYAKVKLRKDYSQENFKKSERRRNK